MKIVQVGILLIGFSGAVCAQALTDAQQKAMNNYISMANNFTREVSSLGGSLTQKYEQMVERRQKPTRPITPYTCRMDASAYYATEAQKTATALGAVGKNFVTKAEAVKQAYQQLDETCKALEIYYRLKDYETDNFARFEELITVLESQLQAYSKNVQELHTETEKLVGTLQPYKSTLPYHKADKLMRTQLAFEKKLLDACIFNVNEEVHTGWPVEVAEKHILDDMPNITALKQGGSGLQYPASSMYKSFVESMESLQQSKRSGVDGYTYENQQSDRHSNEVYRNLINYYNNTGVSFYNNFIGQARQNGFLGVYYLEFVPLFTVRSQAKEINLEVKPFADKDVAAVNVAPVATAVTAAVFSSLSNYVEFINDGVNQVNHMMNSMHGLNSSASYGKNRLRAGGRVNLEYYYKNFTLPVTQYQQTVEQTRVLPAAVQKPLRDQAEVLYAILTELNQWNNLLLAQSAAKQLTKDSMAYVYGIFDRYKTLSEVFDEKKERLFQDVRKIFESYKPANSKSSWQVSGNALLALLDEDKKEIFKSKRFLQGDGSAIANTSIIEQQARTLIVNEFANLTGIEKLGRYNGNCPYSPYEDLAEHSKQFAEALQKAQPGKTSSSYYRHPYNELLHRYNQSLVYDYNKFAELSKVPLLKSVEQVELFEIVPLRPPEASKPTASDTRPVQQATVPAAVAVTTPTQQSQTTQPVTGSVIHDTVRITDIIRIETVRQDTVYVSRVDTVYVGTVGENMLSMEGYATNNMVLLLDVSGSMNTPDKLPLLKKSVLLLLKMMRQEDEVSIVTYSGKAKVALSPTSFKEEEKITKVVERLKSEGKTDGNAGLALAYSTADKNYIRGGNNRIILATDGEFPISEETFQLVKKFSGEDIFISVFNFGKTSQSAKNLQQLVSLGKGNYEYITRENVDVKLVSEAKAKKKK